MAKASPFKEPTTTDARVARADHRAEIARTCCAVQCDDILELFDGEGAHSLRGCCNELGSLLG
jgi:hypothetical protein